MLLTEANKASVDISSQIVNEFGEACKEAFKKQFTDIRENKFRIRMSSIGRPLCQLQMEKSGAEPETMPYNTKMRNLFGDLIEASAVAIMKAAGIRIEDLQKEVKLKLGKNTIKGTYDVKIQNKIWDIKSASPWAFDNKFSDEGGFDAILKQDTFGYVSQGYLYGAAKGIPFGGWIAFNKETGDIAVLKTPENSDAYERRALHTAKINAKALADDAPFERCFKKEAELVRRKVTGNYTLAVNCRYCKFKQSCWGEELVFRKNPRGATSRWYFGEPK